MNGFGVWAFLADFHSLEGTFPFWYHPSMEREKFTVFSEFGVNKHGGFGSEYLSSAGRADQWNQPSLEDTFMPVMDADL